LKEKQVMDPMTMMMLASLPQTLLGGYQTIKGYGTDNERPNFNIPQSAQNALASAERQAAERRMPGQSAIEGRLDSTTANTLQTIERTMDSPVSGINAASRAYGNQLDKETDLGVKSAEFALRNQDILRSQQGIMSEWENKKEEWDTRLPYMQKAAQLSALKEAGLTNLAGGLTDALTGAATMSLFDTAKADKAKLLDDVRFKPDLTGYDPNSLDGLESELGLMSPTMTAPSMSRPVAFGADGMPNSGSPVDLRTGENTLSPFMKEIFTKDKEVQSPMVGLLKELMTSMNTGPQANFRANEDNKNLFDAYFLGITPEFN
jgi:hypothetical protein